MNMDFEFSCDWDDDYQEECLESVFEERKHLEDDAVVVVKKYILNFFQDKEMYYGGEIPRDILFCSENIDLVLNTTRTKGFAIAHEMIDYCDWISSIEDPETQVSEATEKIISICTLCEERRIPPCCMGGIVVMYLELVEGVEPVVGCFES